MSNVLNKICNEKRRHVEISKKLTPLFALKEKISEQTPPRGFLSALQETEKNNKIALIAEVKKASPSKGIIRGDFDPIDIANSYRDADASCLSVLTDEPYFQGHDNYLTSIRTTNDLPLLRKDFMIDPYQIYESRVLGADCVLLIVAALNDALLADLYTLSSDLGMDVLLEVHDGDELDRALKLNPHMVGVNSRNLKTLDVDIQTAHNLLQKMPESIFKIAESGITSHQDILSLQKSGAQGFLIGEHLMREENIMSATKKILGTN